MADAYSPAERLVPPRHPATIVTATDLVQPDRGRPPRGYQGEPAIASDQPVRSGPGRPQIGSGYKLPTLSIEDELRDRILGYQADRGISKRAEAVRELIELGLSAASRGPVDGRSAASRIREALGDSAPATSETRRNGDELRMVRAADLDALLRLADPEPAPGGDGKHAVDVADDQ